MKKLMIFALLAASFAACDPIEDRDTLDMTPVKAEDLGFTLVAKSPGNNNINVIPTPARYVNVYDATTDAFLAAGMRPAIQVTPPVTELKVYVTTMNPDGSFTKSAPGSIAISEYTDLPAIYADVFGQNPDGSYGTTTWTWNDTAPDGVWGNGGYMGNTGPGWWIVSAADIDGQAGAEGLGAWFSLSLSGVKKSTGESGSVKVSEEIAKQGWDIGRMVFSGVTPLNGVQPNVGGKQYDYHILKITPEELRLCAPEPGAGEWGTAWFWNFKSIK